MMNAELIDPFMVSTEQVFSTMLGCQLTRGRLQPRSHRLIPEYEINGIVGLAGSISGTVVLSMQERVALRATEAMLGLHPSFINDEVIDAVGELTNMVAGAAKHHLSTEVNLSIPMVIVGKNTRIGFASNVEPICIPFQSPWGPVQVEVGIAK
jgi:chemotaxis protein CheX